MAIPAYTSADELDVVDPTTNKPTNVVPGEPVEDGAPNRGTLAGAQSTDFLSVLQRVHQTAFFSTTPDATYNDTARTLTLSGDLVISYTVEDPNSSTPLIRTTTLGGGVYSFGGDTILALPLGIDADVSAQADGTVVPSSAGELRFFAHDGEMQQYLKSTASTSGRRKALTHFVFARKAGSSLRLFTGQVLRDGVTLDGMVRDEEYAGDFLSAGLKKLINQDRNVILLGGEQISFVVAGANRRITSSSSDFRIVTAGGSVTTVPGLGTGYTLTATNNVLAVQIFRDGTLSRAASVTNLSTVLSTQDDVIILGLWDTVGDRFHWIDGSVYLPGDQHPLGVCCDVTGDFLIERIVDDEIYDTDADADAGVPAATRRIAWVVDGADREVMRPVTRDSLDASASPAIEIIRVKAAQLDELRTDTSVDVKDVAGTAAMPLSALRVSADEVRSRTGSQISMNDNAGTAGAAVVADSFSATTEVYTPTIRAVGSGSTQVDVIPAPGGGTDAILTVATMRAKFLDATEASAMTDVPSVMSVTDFNNPGSAGALSAKVVHAEDFLRTDTGVVRTTASSMQMKNEDATSYVDVIAGEVSITKLNLLDVGFLPSGAVSVVGDGDVQLEDTVGGTSTSRFTVGTAQVYKLREPVTNPANGVEVRSHDDSGYGDLTLQNGRLGYLYFGASADPTVTGILCREDSLLLKVANSGDTGLKRVRSANTVCASGHVYYSGGSWVFDSNYSAGISSVTEVEVDTATPLSELGGTVNSVRVILSNTFLLHTNWRSAVVHVDAVREASPPAPIMVVTRNNFGGGGWDTLYLQAYDSAGTLLTGANMQQVHFWMSVLASEEDWPNP